MTSPNYLPELDLPEPLRTDIEWWLWRATYELSVEAKNRVCADVKAHAREAYEQLLDRGIDAESASAQVVASLGDHGQARTTYRRIYLTSAEQEWLHELQKRKSRWACLAIECTLALGCAVVYSKSTFTDPGLLLGAVILLVHAASDCAALCLRAGRVTLVRGQFLVSACAVVVYACLARTLAAEPDLCILAAAGSVGRTIDAIRKRRSIMKLSANESRNINP